MVENFFLILYYAASDSNINLRENTYIIRAAILPPLSTGYIFASFQSLPGLVDRIGEET